MRDHRDQPSPGIPDCRQYLLKNILAWKHNQTSASPLEDAKRTLLDDGHLITHDSIANDLDRVSAMFSHQVLNAPLRKHPPPSQYSNAVTDHLHIGQDMRTKEYRFPLVAEAQN